MQTSTEIDKLAEALAKAQKAFAPIPKDREVTVTTQTGGSYKFKYATLDAIHTATMPALAEQGLAVCQGLVTDPSGYALTTKLMHSSGQWMENVTPMFVSGRRGKDGKEYPPGNQELGSAQSYARRYGISALLCVTADEDDDGNIADGNEMQRTPYKPRMTPAPLQRQDRAAQTAEAKKDGLIKINTPEDAKRAAVVAKIKKWADDSVQILNATEWSKANLREYYDTERPRIDWLGDPNNNMTELFDKWNNVYNMADERARA